MSSLPDPNALDSIFARLRRAKPEVIDAIRVILRAFLDETPLEDPLTVVRGMDGKARKRRRQSARGAVKPRRDCRSTNVHGERCGLHGSHAGDHRGPSGKTWHQAQRVKKTKAKAKRK